MISSAAMGILSSLSSWQGLLVWISLFSTHASAWYACPSFASKYNWRQQQIINHQKCTTFSRGIISVPISSIQSRCTVRHDAATIPIVNDSARSQQKMEGIVNTKITLACPDGQQNDINQQQQMTQEQIIQEQKQTENKKQQLKQQYFIHLISLPSKDPTFKSPAEKLVRECWKWKDMALGDGRDYFVPRPRALRAFHSLFVGMEIELEFFEEMGGLEKEEGSNEYKDCNGNMNLVELKLKMPPSGENGDSSSSSSLVVDIPLPKQQQQQQQQQQSTISNPSTSSKLIQTFLIEECAALSNCARLDVILVLRSINTPTSSTSSIVSASEHAARYAVAYHLEQQIQKQQMKKTSKSTASLLEKTGLASWLDLPGVVDTTTELSGTAATTASNATRSAEEIIIVDNSEMRKLSSRLTSLTGAPTISNHLSLIAGGLSPRPNRPEREVIFRPYSSRDAHILLQLKRTVEVVSSRGDGDGGGSSNGNGGNRGGGGSGGGGRIKILLNGALSAGKAVRNEDIVPQIRQLKEYGSDGTPPIALANEVATAAIELGVKPSVASCIERLTAMETADQIANLRSRVNVYVDSLLQQEHDQKSISKNGKVNLTEVRDLSKMKIELQKRAKELLHRPTMRLREGFVSEEEVDVFIARIEKELEMLLKDLII